ncbi:uncharacterized protein N7500_000695, partial [Penicillium coprophilum]|uniref:uncharacterized protein n=1 Tax=Penicillium coprophilum TaxID=36646 RepID=UPI00239AE1E9
NDVDEAFGASNAVPRTDAHPITRAVAQAIAEVKNVHTASILPYRRAPMFEPSLPAIYEEGYYAVLGRTEKNNQHSGLSSYGTKSDTMKAWEKDSLSMMQLSTNKTSQLSNFTASDLEDSYKQAGFAQIPL